MKSRMLVRIACVVVATSVLAILPAVGRADHAVVSITGPGSVGEGAGTATYEVKATIAEALEADHSIPYTTENGSATEPGDYTKTEGTITIPAGATEATATINVPIVGDGTDEPNETFAFKAGNQSKSTTINDDDDPPAASVSGTASVSEGAATNLTVTLAAASAQTVTVPYSLSGTAAAGPDYTTAPASPIVFNPGETSKGLAVSSLNDTLDEVDETVVVTVGSSSATVTITDNDNPPAASINDPAPVTEGNGGLTDLKFTVSLSAPSGKEVRVNWSTAPGTAATPEDFEGASNTLVFAPGQTTAEVVVKVKGDQTPEADETLFVNLAQANDTATIGDGQGVGTIKNDDGKPALTVEGATASEGPNAKLVFKVKLSAKAGQNVTVAWATADRSAVGPVDYEVRSGVLVFEPGADKPLEHLVEVPIADDTLDEPTEEMVVRLSQATNADITVGEAVGAINDNDSTSAVAADDATADELETGTSKMAFTVRLQPASARTVEADWAALGGTATAGSDFQSVAGTVAFAPGETEKTVEVTIVGDAVNEPNETLTLQIGAVRGARKADGGDGMGTIVDKSAPPSLSISDAFGRESEGMSFTVTLAGNTTRNVTLHFATSDGTARAGADYAARNGTLTFAPGEKTKVLEVTVHDDTAPEVEETLSMSISDVVNGAITKATGVGRIEANDPVSAIPRSNGPNTPPLGPTVPTRNNGPRMSFAPKTIVATAAGVVRFQVTCSKLSTANGCRGTAILGETKARKPRRFGSKAFVLRAGQRATVGVKLTKAAFALLKRKKVLKARLTVHVRDGSRTIKASPGVVTLRAKPARRSKEVVVNR